MDKVSRGFHFAPEVLKGLAQIEFGQLTVFDQPTTPNKMLKIHFVWLNFRELAKKIVRPLKFTHVSYLQKTHTVMVF